MTVATPIFDRLADRADRECEHEWRSIDNVPVLASRDRCERCGGLRATPARAAGKNRPASATALLGEKKTGRRGGRGGSR